MPTNFVLLVAVCTGNAGKYQYDAVFFPDDGAQKRFGGLFKEFGWGEILGYATVSTQSELAKCLLGDLWWGTVIRFCAKIRRGKERIVDVQSGPDIKGTAVPSVSSFAKTSTVPHCIVSHVRCGLIANNRSTRPYCRRHGSLGWYTGTSTA